MNDRFKEDYAVKIDNQAVDGLTGVEGSLVLFYVMTSGMENWI